MEIPLTQGRVALVSPGDYALVVGEGKWHFDRYAKRVNHGEVLYMHRLIMSPQNGQVVDHINGDKLDNRRENLRLCTQSENNANSASKGSLHKGTSWDPRRMKWKMTFSQNYQKLQVRFDTQEEAASAYGFLAHELFGAYART